MFLIRLTFIASMVAVPDAVLAQAAPTFDCAKAESSAEKLICAEPELAALDQILADRYAAALEKADSQEAGAEATKNTLRALQRGWISGRNECWKESDLYECIEVAYLRREAELVAEFRLEAPKSSIEFSCEDGARRLKIEEFDTPLPGVRVEEGDEVSIGAQLSREAPSTYYLRSVGGLVLEEDSALVQDAYGNETECMIVK